MAELSSSKNLPANNTGNSGVNPTAGTNPNPSSNSKNNANNVNNNNNPADSLTGSQQANEQAKPALSFLYRDVFNSTNQASASRIGEEASKNPYVQGTGQPIQNPRVRPLSFMTQTTAAHQQKIIESVNTVQTDMQSFISNFMSRFVDITDKISAVFGEREKDIRERLSDTFKQVEIKLHELFAPVDASFEQKDHHRENKTKDQEQRNPDEDQFIHTHRID